MNKTIERVVLISVVVAIVATIGGAVWSGFHPKLPDGYIVQRSTTGMYRWKRISDGRESACARTYRHQCIYGAIDWDRIEREVREANAMKWEDEK